MSLEIRRDLSICVRAPMRTSDREIQAFLKEKETWLCRHLAEMKMRAAAQAQIPKLTNAELRELADRAGRILPQRQRRTAHSRHSTATGRAIVCG